MVSIMNIQINIVHHLKTLATVIGSLVAIYTFLWSIGLALVTNSQVEKIAWTVSEKRNKTFEEMDLRIDALATQVTRIDERSTILLEQLKK